MPWLADVVPYATIQSLWGNQIRDRVVMTFANVAERDANAAKMPEGQLAYCVAEQSLYVRRPTAAGGFGTLAQPWQNYALTYQLSGAFPVNITIYEARYRRVAARTVEVSAAFAVAGNYSSGIDALIWNLPVPCLAGGDQVIGSGEGYDTNKYCVGPVKRHQTDPNWAYIIDQNARDRYKPVTGTPIVRATMRYEVADG